VIPKLILTHCFVDVFIFMADHLNWLWL